MSSSHEHLYSDLYGDHVGRGLGRRLEHNAGARERDHASVRSPNRDAPRIGTTTWNPSAIIPGPPPEAAGTGDLQRQRPKFGPIGQVVNGLRRSLQTLVRNSARRGTEETVETVYTPPVYEYSQTLMRPGSVLDVNALRVHAEHPTTDVPAPSIAHSHISDGHRSYISHQT